MSREFVRLDKARLDLNTFDPLKMDQKCNCDFGYYSPFIWFFRNEVSMDVYAQEAYCSAEPKKTFGRRRMTREVFIGQIPVGGVNPIRIQSMTATPTSDVQATVNQIIELADQGCEIARVTVQGIKESASCEKIKDSLLAKGYTIPLVADIHFFPAAALHVADFVEKIRINPGNFVDKRNMFMKINEQYDEKQIVRDLEKIETKLFPLIEKCKKFNRSLRIGVNHGSLSERIMRQYGDTVRGMVESALEFTSVFRKYGFHNLIYSMKSSNPQVMIEAYRLLVTELDSRGWDYPLHLGVTEAGAGLSGRIKSSVGIGTLLAEGLGDTIRVSLTEHPVKEIIPCQNLIQITDEYSRLSATTVINQGEISTVDDEFETLRYRLALNIFDHEIEQETFFTDLGLTNITVDSLPLQSPDIVFINPSLINHPKIEILKKAGMLVVPQTVKSISSSKETDKINSRDYYIPNIQFPDLNYFIFEPGFPNIDNTVLFFSKKKHLKNQAIVKITYDEQDKEKAVIAAGTEFGALLNENLCSIIFPDITVLNLDERRLLGLTLLQATRKRLFATDFISCPGCGRTLFDIQTVTERIREKTDHLVGLKIAVMGCIVNGPGEMADADFGYVGSKAGKIDLYVKHTCVKRDIDMHEADEALINLIKSHDRWVEPISKN